MPEIKIQTAHNLGREEAHRRVQQVETELNQKYGVKFDWQGDRAEVHAKGLSGLIVVEDERVAVDLKLGLALIPLQGKLRSEVKERMDRALS
jgi:putative polyhydroxyalkanoate system protein